MQSQNWIQQLLRVRRPRIKQTVSQSSSGISDTRGIISGISSLQPDDWVAASNIVVIFQVANVHNVLQLGSHPLSSIPLLRDNSCIYPSESLHWPTIHRSRRGALQLLCKDELPAKWWFLKQQELIDTTSKFQIMNFKQHLKSRQEKPTWTPIPPPWGTHSRHSPTRSPPWMRRRPNPRFTHGWSWLLWSHRLYCPKNSDIRHMYINLCIYIYILTYTYDYIHMYTYVLYMILYPYHKYFYNMHLNHFQIHSFNFHSRDFAPICLKT